MLFTLYLSVNDAPEISNPKPIVVDEVHLRCEACITAFERTWLRAPTARELDGLIRNTSRKRSCTMKHWRWAWTVTI